MGSRTPRKLVLVYDLVKSVFCFFAWVCSAAIFLKVFLTRSGLYLTVYSIEGDRKLEEGMPKVHEDGTLTQDSCAKDWSLCTWGAPTMPRDSPVADLKD